jgi:phage tail sheath protein FI
MGDYKHGVHITELPTSLFPPVSVSSGLPFVVGTAPGPLEGVLPVNEPKLIYSYKEFVEIFGWDDNTEDYTLCEFAQVYFGLYGVCPAVFVNVYDDSVHTTGVSDVVSDDIIGGIDETTGKKTGLELIGDVFTRFRLVPGTIVCPGFSDDPTVAVTMGAKTDNISGHFKAVAVVDVPETVTKYSDVPSYKETNSLTDPNIIVCWPKLKYGEKYHRMSSHVAGLISRTDGEHEGVPYKSPSNENFVCIGAGIAGEEVFLSPEEAAYLNGQGIVTALNFVGGWKCWGNRTGAYPAVTDVKDCFIPVRRTFNWIGDTLVLSAWQKLDAPIRKRLVETVVDSFNIWLNGIASREIILGGRVAFLESDNPVTDVMDGIVRFHVYVTPPSPAREIDFIVEYDPDYIQELY